MSTGADNKTMPVTREYEEGYERIFGKDREPVRGFWVWDESQKKFVRPEEKSAGPAPRVHLQTDEGFEGLRATDGTDISSRTKWKRYMDEHGLAMASDYKETWEKAAKEREARTKPGYGREERIADIKRVMEMNPRDVANIARRARETALRDTNRPVPTGAGWED